MMDLDFRQKLQEEFKKGYAIERSRAGLRGLNPLDAPPSWLDEELRDALNAIGPPHERKKRTTVLRLAEAKAMGLNSLEVFKSEDCCSTSSWYTRKSPVYSRGWCEDPDIAAAYELALRKANAFHDDQEMQRLAMRRHVLNDTQDRLTELALAAAEVLLDIMADPQAASDVRRKAAVDVLTHAAPETAPKSRTDQVVDLRLEADGPSMRDIRTKKRKLPDRVVDAEFEEVPVLEAVANEEEGPPPPPPGGLRIPDAGLYDEPPLISDNGHGEGDEGD